MKTNIQVLLSKIEKKEKLPNVFFLFGNDQGIISGMVSAVYNYHKKNNLIWVINFFCHITVIIEMYY